jgi:hypothetical protein
MFFIFAGILFGAFVANVISGSLSGQAVLSDVHEMLLLMASAVCFSVAILIAEARSRKNKHKTN